MDIDLIIDELKKHDQSHFNDFYQQTSRQIYFTAFNILKDHGLAEDIMQDTYVLFLNNIEQYKNGNNVFAYLSTIARNLSINQYNKLKRVVQNDEMIALQPVYDNPHEQSNIEETLSLLDTDLEREIVTFHAIFDYKFVDIAKIIDKPLGTILWIYNKAMKKLKERMCENEK